MPRELAILLKPTTNNSNINSTLFVSLCKKRKEILLRYPQLLAPKLISQHLFKIRNYCFIKFLITFTHPIPKSWICNNVLNLAVLYI